MFCKKCGSILLPRKEGKKTVLACSCGFKSSDSSGSMLTETVQHKGRKVEVIEEEDRELQTLPKMKAHCRKCGNEEAYFWEVQTRAADEPATKFLKCVKCKYTWRDYN